MILTALVVSTCPYPNSPWRDRIVMRRAFESQRWAVLWVRFAAIWADVAIVPYAEGGIGVDWYVVPDPRGELMRWPPWEALTTEAVERAQA